MSRSNKRSQSMKGRLRYVARMSPRVVCHSHVGYEPMDSERRIEEGLTLPTPLIPIKIREAFGLNFAAEFEVEVEVGKGGVDS